MPRAFGWSIRGASSAASSPMSGPPGSGDPDRGHGLGVEHVGVDVDPEGVEVVRRDAVEHGGCRFGEGLRRDGAAAGCDRCPGQVEDPRNGEPSWPNHWPSSRRPDQRDVLCRLARTRGSLARLRARAACRRGPPPARYPPVRHRARHRFLRTREIGVPVDIREADPARTGFRATSHDRHQRHRGGTRARCCNRRRSRRGTNCPLMPAATRLAIDRL